MKLPHLDGKSPVLWRMFRGRVNTPESLKGGSGQGDPLLPDG